MRIHRLAVLIGICLALPVADSGCGPDLSPDFGVMSIDVASQGKLYFKREARGLNYDSLVLSADGNPCAEYQLASDYRFRGLGPHVIYYKVEGDTLHLYSAIGADTPDSFPSPVKIEPHVYSPLEWRDLQESHREKGLTKLEVGLNAKCN